MHDFGNPPNFFEMITPPFAFALSLQTLKTGMQMCDPSASVAALEAIQQRLLFLERCLSRREQGAPEGQHATAEALRTVGIECTELAKRPEDGAMTGMDAIEQGLVDLVINIPITYDEVGRPDGSHIRRRAVDAGIPLITDLQRAQAIIEALRHRKVKDLAILSWDEYAARRPMALK